MGVRDFSEVEVKEILVFPVEDTANSIAGFQE